MADKKTTYSIMGIRASMKNRKGYDGSYKELLEAVYPRVMEQMYLLCPEGVPPVTEKRSPVSFRYKGITLPQRSQSWQE